MLERTIQREDRDASLVKRFLVRHHLFLQSGFTAAQTRDTYHTQAIDTNTAAFSGFEFISPTLYAADLALGLSLF